MPTKAVARDDGVRNSFRTSLRMGVPPAMSSLVKRMNLSLPADEPKLQAAMLQSVGSGVHGSLVN